jgi:predicted O-methyltransferase YrrM
MTIPQPGNRVIQGLRLALWEGRDPFGGVPRRLIDYDIQGWGSQHPWLVESIDRLRPERIVEVGVWKGGSTIHMAQRLKDLGLDAAIIAVDTWLGSWDHWVEPGWRQELCFVNGYPRLFEKFASNIVHRGLEDKVIPLPLDSTNARNVISHLNIQADIIHIDGGHDYETVWSDVTQWWKVLRPGGILIGDDYTEGGVEWPGVHRAFSEFTALNLHTEFEFHNYKCRMIKK